MTLISIELPLIQLVAENVTQDDRSIIKENLIRLPFYFDENSEPFLGLHHLHSLYRESYFCILHGLYHAGIIIMPQLLEEVLREIIRVHTGVPNGSAFEGLLSAMPQHSKVTPKPYLVHPEFVIQLIKIKEDIRNPYTHLRYKKIFHGKTIPGVKFQGTGTDPEEIRDELKEGLQAAKEGKLQFNEYDPSVDPVVASYVKEDIDKTLAIQLAWSIYPLYWLLLEEYLNKDIITASVHRFGSVWEPKFEDK